MLSPLPEARFSNNQFLCSTNHRWSWGKKNKTTAAVAVLLVLVLVLIQHHHHHRTLYNDAPVCSFFLANTVRSTYHRNNKQAAIRGDEETVCALYILMEKITYCLFDYARRFFVCLFFCLFVDVKHANPVMAKAGTVPTGHIAANEAKWCCCAAIDNIKSNVALYLLQNMRMNYEMTNVSVLVTVLRVYVLCALFFTILPKRKSHRRERNQHWPC